jgi:Ca2+-binding EF-hand superfamily protein
VKQLYQLLDSDGDGVLTRKELDSGIGNLGLDLSQEDIALLISVIDKNNDGVIDEFEFVANIGKFRALFDMH